MRDLPLAAGRGPGLAFPARGLAALTRFVDADVCRSCEGKDVVMGPMMILPLGGAESPAGLIGNMPKPLAEHPSQRPLLPDDSALVPQALEEPAARATLQLTTRTVMRHATPHDVTIPARSDVVPVRFTPAGGR